MSPRITAPFEVTEWGEEPYLQPEDGPALARVTVRKRFSGPLEGESVAELLTARSEGGRGYVGSELVVATLDGRAGAFVIQHGGAEGGGADRAFGHVVPGSGTGALRGLRGEAAFEHDERGARLHLDYEV